MKSQRTSRGIALNLALDGGGWSTPRPGHFTPGKDPVPIVQEAGWGPRASLDEVENLAAIRIRSVDCQACRKSANALCNLRVSIFEGYNDC